MYEDKYGNQVDFFEHHIEQCTIDDIEDMLCLDIVDWSFVKNGE